MLKRVVNGKIVFIDETTVNLMGKKKGKAHQAYMWLLCGGGNSKNPPYQMYTFADNRRHDNAIQLLDGFSGIMHSDKYGAYESLNKNNLEISWQACWAHIRRKFEESQSGDLELRNLILRNIRYLYMFERIAWSRTEAERLEIRKKKEAPIIDKLIKLIQEKVISGDLLPKSNFAKAINYFNGLIPYLKAYHADSNAHIDNNVAERAARAVAMGRKNWLFVGSMKGGQAAAILLSLVQSCRNLQINPRDYLEDVMRRFYNQPANKLSELLPDEWQKNTQQDSQQTKPLHVR